MPFRFNLLFFMFCIVFSFSQCKEEKLVSLPSSKMVQKSMVDSISQIIRKSNLSESIYDNTIRSKMMKEQLDQSYDPMLHFNYARELLNSGKTQEAISIISSIINSSAALKNITQKSKVLHDFLAICYLRLGEQENCQHNHNDASCIIPIQEKGIHIKPIGSEKAIEKYSEILAVFPDDYQSRWLLNLAYMTLDKHPSEVPSKFLINIGTKSSSASFQNVASQMGIDMFDLSGGVITDDFNNDGLMDIMTSSWGMQGTIKYYINKGESGFVDGTAEAGLDKIKGGLNLKQADVDNDGDLDFIILRGGWRPKLEWGVLPNSLMINMGDGKFEDQTIERGMYSVRPTQSSEWFDFNNDGWIDLFVANETNTLSTQNFPCELFINDGRGSFSNEALNLNAAQIGYFKGVSSGDMNNDGFRDIFLSNLDGPNVLLQNEGGRVFKNVSATANVSDPQYAFPCWFFDANNDGWDDLFVASYSSEAFLDQGGQFARDVLGLPVNSEATRIHINTKKNSFRDETKSYLKYSALSTMGSNYGDIDNDGYLDLYLGTGAPDYRAVVPNRFFTNKGGTRFEDQTFQLGLGHIQKGHGIAFSDLDNDGDQDIYAVMGGAFEGDIFPNALFENPGNTNRWIKLKLEGTESNRSAIGARIQIICTSENKEQSIFHTVNSGGSFGANSLTAHIGIGSAETIQRIIVTWPNAQHSKQEFINLETNAMYLIEENNPNAQKLAFQSFVFNKNNSSGHAHHHH